MCSAILVKQAVYLLDLFLASNWFLRRFLVESVPRSDLGTRNIGSFVFCVWETLSLLSCSFDLLFERNSVENARLFIVILFVSLGDILS